MRGWVEEVKKLCSLKFIDNAEKRRIVPAVPHPMPPNMTANKDGKATTLEEAGIELLVRGNWRFHKRP
jgi:hypothetical protein